MSLTEALPPLTPMHERALAYLSGHRFVSEVQVAQQLGTDVITARRLLGDLKAHGKAARKHFWISRENL